MGILIVSPEQVQRAMQSIGKTWFPHHRCGGCDAWVGYYLEGGEPYFDPRCDCGSGGSSMHTTWKAIAGWVNMQTNDEAQDRILRTLGLRIDQPEETKARLSITEATT